MFATLGAVDEGTRRCEFHCADLVPSDRQGSSWVLGAWRATLP